MNINQETVNNGVLSEFAYIKFENYTGNLENSKNIEKWIDDSPKDISGIPPIRIEAMKEILQD